VRVKFKKASYSILFLVIVNIVCLLSAQWATLACDVLYPVS